MKNKITLSILGMLLALIMLPALSQGQCPDGLSASPFVTNPILCNGATTGSAEAGATGGTSPYTYSWSSGGGINASINSYYYPVTQIFSYEPAIQNFTVPAGVPQITISISGGAGGGDQYDVSGGTGASFSGVYTVTSGDVLSVVVGQMGGNANSGSDGNGGGGGASWVYDSTITGAHTGTPSLSSLLVVAAGGGGAGYNGAIGGAGGTDLIGNSATNGQDGNAPGGTGGNGGGIGAGGNGAGGGGWISNGENSIGTYTTVGGSDWANSFVSAAGVTGGIGGFGGGGGGGTVAAGGGGGYNGGGGGDGGVNGGAGDGGGSYFNTAYGSLPGSVTATNTGNGSVTISYLIQNSLGLAAGTYSVTITDNNGCAATASVTLTQPGVLRDSISSVTQLCSGGSTGSATVGVKYGTSPYTYSWSTGSSAATVSGLSAGTYAVTVQDSCGGAATASVTISQAGALSVTASIISSNACTGGANGNAEAFPSGGGSPYTYSWSNGVTTASTGSVLSAGTYTVTVQDNCGTSASTTVIMSSSALQDSIVPTSIVNILCYGESTGAAEVGVKGGVSPYTYSWSEDGGTNAVINSYDISGTQTFSYEPAIQNFTVPVGITQVSITVTGAAGGQYNGTPGGTGASFTGVSTVTPGHVLSIVVGDTGGYTISYAGGGGGASWVYDSTLTGAHTGTPSLSALLAVAGGGGGDGHTDSDLGGAGGTNLTTNATTVGGHAGSSAGGTGGNGGGGGNSSTGGNSSAGGAGGAGWISNGGTYSPGPLGLGGNDWANNFTSAAGYQVSYGGYGGGGGGIENGGGGGGGGYNGGGGGFTGGGAGGGGGGGSYFNTAYGSLPTNATATNTGNGSVTISYSSISGTGLKAGTYSVTVTDANGCAVTASVTLTQPNALSSVTANMLNSASNGESNGNASANLSGGTTPYTYTWSNGLSTVSVSNPTGSVLSAGTYTVTVQDNCGASAMASVTIYNTLTASITTASDVSCYDGNNGSVSASPSGGKSPYTYSWGGGEGSNSTISELHAGVYSVTVWDNLGASATASVKITQPATVLTAAAVTAANVSCNGGSNGVAKVSVSGGKAPYAYFWSPNTSSTYIASGLSAGTYTVTVVDNNGCNASSSTTLTQPTLLKDSVSTVTYPQCGGETAGATIGVTGGTSPYRYTWSPNVSTTATATGLTIRGYVVQVKDVNGCYNDLSFSITQPPVPVLRDSMVRAATVNVSCNGSSNGSATVGVKYGTPPYTYSWSVGGGTNATINGLSVGTYSVTVNDAGGCTATASVSIGQSSSPLSSVTAFVSANVSCNGGSSGQAKVSVVGGSSPFTYSWNSGSNGYIANGLSAGAYTVTVTDNCGASASSSVAVTQPAILSDSVITSSIVSPPCSGGGTGSAAIGVTGGTSPYRYTWSPNVSTTDSASGLTVRGYVVQVKDVKGCYNDIIVNITCSSAPATATYKGDDASCCPVSDNINLYPNPNTGQFTLSGLQQGMILEMYDYTGKMISTMTTTNETMQLNILNQANGIYLIRILDKDGNLISEKKVVKTQ